MPDHSATQPHLDPDDWDEFRRDSHRALDEMIDYIRNIREAPVWQQMPQDVLDQFQQALPRQSSSLPDVLNKFSTTIKPYATGNVHPLFMGWVHGAGTPVGMLAEMLAAGLNANCGGRNHVGLAVERQITGWAADLLGFPQTSSGIFVTGTSAANHLALLVARSNSTDHNIRKIGLRETGAQFVVYASAEAHGCITTAVEISGIGSNQLRLIPTDSQGRIRLDLLKDAIATDRRAGRQPLLVVGTAGTVNYGAFDDLISLAAICRTENLWFHVDGAFGALCALTPSLSTLVSGIEKADSVAFDFHKWAHVPYDAGFLLVRDAEAHRRTFSNQAAYLSRASRGLAAGEIWPCDLGPDLSRGFRALKTWFTFQVFGADRIGACIEHTCRVAKYLETLLSDSDLFETSAPVPLNIVCFSLKTSSNDEWNKRIAVDLQERGLAAPSMTMLNGRAVMRAAIVNHRTTEQDMDTFVAELRNAALRVASDELSTSGDQQFDLAATGS